MKSHREIKQGPYDAIVVGAGIGGLTTAALMARSGKRVLVVERHDRPGGYAHGFRRKRYTFDSGVHLISGCGPTGFVGGQIIHRIVNAVGIENDVEFIPVNPYTRATFPGFILNIPQGEDAFIHALAQGFPNEKKGISELFSISLKLAEEASTASHVIETGTPPEVRERLATLFRYRKTTLKQVLDQYLSDQKLKGFFSTLWPYLGLPPSRLSFLYWSIMFIGYTIDGAYYCKGTFQNYANALANCIEANSGEVLYKTPIQQINIASGKVHGVTLMQGQRIKAPVVMSNADASQTVYSLVGADKFPASYLRRFKQYKPSISAFVVYIATNLDLEKQGVAHEGFFYSGFDHEHSFKKSLAGEVSWISVTIPTLLDASLAPKGEHLILLTTLMPFDLVSSWRDAKLRFQNAMLDLADRYLTGLKDHLLFVEAGSPATMERYTQNTQGAAYGWESSPDHVGANRLSNRSPIDGLFLAGHWTIPGGGVNGVSVSGVETAQAILGFDNPNEFWETFKSARE